MNFCPQCGSKVLTDALHCVECSARVTNTESEFLNLSERKEDNFSTKSNDDSKKKFTKSRFLTTLVILALGIFVSTAMEHSQGFFEIGTAVLMFLAAVMFFVQSRGRTSLLMKVLIGTLGALVFILTSGVFGVLIEPLLPEATTKSSTSIDSKITVLFVLSVAAPCNSPSGFSDITEGVQVHILDSSNKLLGSGVLGKGEKVQGGKCAFSDLKFKVNRSVDGIYKAQVGNESRGYITSEATEDQSDVFFLAKLG
jgi:hypothetical protein